MSALPHGPSTPPPQPPAGLQPLGRDRASRSRATDPDENAHDGAVPESDAASKTAGPTPTDYAKRFALISDAVLTGVIPPGQAKAAATCLRHSFDVLNICAPDRNSPSSSGTAHPQPTHSENPASHEPRTADTDQMRVIIDVFLEHAPHAFPEIDSMLTDADRGYVQARYTTPSP